MSPSSSSSPSNAPWIHSSPFLSTTTTASSPAAKASSSSSSSSSTTTRTAAAALIILNAPIRSPPSAVFCKLWEQSSFRVCADGGANRLYQATVAVSYCNRSSRENDDDKNGKDEDGSNGDGKNESQNQDNKMHDFLPSLITGDLDSLQDHVRDYYTRHGVPIVRVDDQDCNDLDKSLQAMQEQAKAYEKYDTCYIYGAFGGRLDQEMASLQALYKYTAPTAKRQTSEEEKNDSQQQQQQHHSYFQNLWLYNDRNVAILLRPNHKHVLHFPNYDDDNYNNIADKSGRSMGEQIIIRNGDKQKKQLFALGEGPTCGLIPLGFACENVTTTGLKWNLHQDALSFGGLVSTSNRMMAATVTVEIFGGGSSSSSQHPLLFTAEIIQNSRSNDNKNSSNVEEEGW